MSKPFGFVTDKGKVVKSNVLKQYQNEQSESKQINDRFEDTYGKKGLVEPLYNPEALIKMLEMNTYHYRCCKTKARDTAGLGWDLTEYEEGNANDANKKTLLDFLKKQPVNIVRTFEKAMVDYEAVGQFAIEVRRVGDDGNGEPNVMYHIPVHTLRKHQEENKFCQVRGNKTRWFKSYGYDKDVHFEDGSEHELNTLAPQSRATEVLWNFNYTPRSDFYGLPDVMPAIGAIHGDLARRDFNIAFFDNYGVPTYAVTITGNYDPGDYDEESEEYELEKAIKEHFEQLQKNPHSTLILSVPSADGEGEVKVNFEPLSVDVKEASFRLYRKDNRDEVLSAHGVPPYRLGIAETGSLGGSTANESTEIYKVSVIHPRQEMLEEMINNHIIRQGFDIHDWVFRFDKIDTRDEKQEIEVAVKLFDRAAMTPNELIAQFSKKFGLAESDHEEMDYHYLNGNAIEGEVDPQQAQGVMFSLQQQLLDMVEKEVDGNASSKHGKDGNPASKMVELIKKLAPSTATDGKKVNKRIK